MYNNQNMIQMEFIIWGGAFFIGVIIGTIFCSIYGAYTWIIRITKLKKWYKRTEISDQDIERINKQLKNL